MNQTRRSVGDGTILVIPSPVVTKNTTVSWSQRNVEIPDEKHGFQMGVFSTGDGIINQYQPWNLCATQWLDVFPNGISHHLRPLLTYWLGITFEVGVRTSLTSWLAESEDHGSILSHLEELRTSWLVLCWFETLDRWGLMRVGVARICCWKWFVEKKLLWTDSAWGGIICGNVARICQDMFHKWNVSVFHREPLSEILLGAMPLVMITLEKKKQQLCTTTIYILSIYLLVIQHDNGKSPALQSDRRRTIYFIPTAVQLPYSKAHPTNRGFVKTPVKSLWI